MGITLGNVFLFFLLGMETQFSWGINRPLKTGQVGKVRKSWTWDAAHAGVKSRSLFIQRGRDCALHSLPVYLFDRLWKVEWICKGKLQSFSFLPPFPVSLTKIVVFFRLLHGNNYSEKEYNDGRVILTSCVQKIKMF